MVKGRSLTKDAYVLEMWTTAELGMVSLDLMHHFSIYDNTVDTKTRLNKKQKQKI